MTMKKHFDSMTEMMNALNELRKQGFNTDCGWSYIPAEESFDGTPFYVEIFGYAEYKYSFGETAVFSFETYDMTAEEFEEEAKKLNLLQ